MAFLGSFGKYVGGAAKKLAPVAGLIPGIGTAAAAGIGGLGALMEGGSKTKWGDVAKAAAGGALGGIGGNILGSALGGAAGGAGGAGGILSQALGGAKALGGSALNFAKSNPELLLGGISAVRGAQKQSEADKLRGQAVQGIQGDVSRRNDLMEMLMGRVASMPTQGPDLSAIFGGSQNPFARRSQLPPEISAMQGLAGRGQAMGPQ